MRKLIKDLLQFSMRKIKYVMTMMLMNNSNEDIAMKYDMEKHRRERIKSPLITRNNFKVEEYKQQNKYVDRCGSR